MPLPKFSFVPERQLSLDVPDPTYKVTISKRGVLVFGKEVLDIYELENKYIRLYADIQKKTIGWSIIEGETNLELLNDARLVKKYTNGCSMIGIGKILRLLSVEKGKIFRDLDVKKYKSPLIGHDIWYIELQ